MRNADSFSANVRTIFSISGPEGSVFAVVEKAGTARTAAASSATHAALHYVNGTALFGSLARLRPFVTAGLGTIEVFPGAALNARSVTKLLLDAGGGTHFFLRDDVALRLEARSFTVLDQQEAHRGAYHYVEWSGGLTFYRSSRAPETSETGAAP